MAYTVSQLPAPVDFYLVPGDDFTATVTLGVNIAGYTFAAPIETPTPSSFGVAVVDAPTGKISMTLTNTQTAAITSAVAYSLQWTDGSSKKLTILCGTVNPRC